MSIDAATVRPQLDIPSWWDDVDASLSAGPDSLDRAFNAILMDPAYLEHYDMSPVFPVPTTPRSLFMHAAFDGAVAAYRGRVFWSPTPQDRGYPYAFFEYDFLRTDDVREREDMDADLRATWRWNVANGHVPGSPWARVAIEDAAHDEEELRMEEEQEEEEDPKEPLRFPHNF